MSKTKSVAPQTHKILMEAEVARQVRQHSRTSMKAEVCGVLIGREEGPTTIVEACIEGANAAQGGAHVTFTQDTWEHIYQIKDKKYPNDRIVGWYHSHPGFGVFLSDHDLFIHQNFFSSPQQIAWVFDPHSDEEGCFGWNRGEIDKIDDVAFRYSQACGESVVADPENQDEPLVKIGASWKDEWKPLLRDCIMALLFFVIGAFASYYYIGTKAVLLPRGEHALVFLNDDQVVVVPPEIATQILNTMRRELEAGNPFLQSPASSGGQQQQPVPAKPNGDQQGGQNDRKK